MESKEYHGHCVQCKQRVLLVDPMEHKLPNGRTRNKNVNMVKGRCPHCDRSVYTVVGHG